MYEDLEGSGEVFPPNVQIMVAKYTSPKFPSFSQTLREAGLTTTNIRDLLKDFKSEYRVTLTEEDVEGVSIDEIVTLLKRRRS